MATQLRVIQRPIPTDEVCRQTMLRWLEQALLRMRMRIGRTDMFFAGRVIIRAARTKDAQDPDA